MHEPYQKYMYDGPVLVFHTLVADRWKGETRALNARKARSNLSYQFKKQNNRMPGVKVTLPGEVKMVN